ncbi:hypothetical protein [Pseudogemmobacter blasticus]|uniref:DUF4333 domain-containing protein n=1 Tax=Fuscovulum blasticum DSM 2131 TaxID=1188250 RepID=A0A2T4J6Q7_FUSBL|nr:hypothetical protein [Fuscovulum blasticum]AWD22885.1 hypothetical protein B6K69_15345 [Fuscovulum blasticum]PTE13584.1 hypothetical protein C5F44_13605 [Fuscovulum blasticum DSM 2131]
MKTFLKLFPLVVVAALAAIWFTVGPSVLYGGPKKSDIIAVTRTVMAATAPDAALAEAAKAATVTPGGLCSKNNDGSFACMVDVQIAGAPVQSLVAVLKKGADGVWTAAD